MYFQINGHTGNSFLQNIKFDIYDLLYSKKVQSTLRSWDIVFHFDNISWAYHLITTECQRVHLRMLVHAH